MTQALLSVQRLTKRFTKSLDAIERAAVFLGARTKPAVVHAVDDVSFSVSRGEVIGLVGESGSGKSTVGRMIAGLLRPTAGEIHYKGRNVAGLSGIEAKDAALKIQMIFQDPMSSLNPRMRVGNIIGEAPRAHGQVKRGDIDHHVVQIMRRVGLDPEVKERYPHQFSGGQRARIGIARALAVNPDFLICDESVAALDVSIQAQVLNLFIELRERLGLTYLFISHDLGVVEHISDRVIILYLGRVIESAPTEEFFREPNHPYSRALLAEVPRIQSGKRRFSPIPGEIPSPLAPPAGCHFHTRCPRAFSRCRNEQPLLKSIADGRLSACHLND